MGEGEVKGTNGTNGSGMESGSIYAKTSGGSGTA